jgi:DnaJ-class molecular chaperone
LTPLQHRALAELIELGAALDDAFTAEELRTAFRHLARRLHPDRHPTASERETSRLAAAFARAKAAYDDLKRAA